MIRRGRVVGTTVPSASESELASLMVGRTVDLQVHKTPAEPGAAVLRIGGLRVRDDRGQLAVDGVDLDVRAGEMLGVAGVQGNGQTELVEALMGLRRPDSGSITLNGTELVGRTPHQVLSLGVGYVPEDRSGTAWSRTSRSPRTWCWTAPTSRRTRPAGRCAPG